jgi:hypothetical protein
MKKPSVQPLKLEVLFGFARGLRRSSHLGPLDSTDKLPGFGRQQRRTVPAETLTRLFELVSASPWAVDARPREP